MKKLLNGIMVFGLFVCNAQTSKDYVSLSGTITNKNSDYLIIRSGKYNKKIHVNQDGTFSDTLKVERNFYGFNDGTNYSRLYLENGYDLTITTNGKQFDQSLAFKGIGYEANNFLVELSLAANHVLVDARSIKENPLYDMEEMHFNKVADSIIEALNVKFAAVKHVDSIFTIDIERRIKSLETYMQNKYDFKQYMKRVLTKGKPAPTFTNFENYAGGTLSLDHLKGKYVFIDFWATWCGPCLRQAPYLNEIEKKYHENDNIVFVSISIDEQANKDKWKKTIADKALGGIQLLADNGKASQITKDYRLIDKKIPAFILIDPNGNIVTADAPFPSDEKLIELLDSLKI